jgi:hypothetical protein
VATETLCGESRWAPRVSRSGWLLNHVGVCAGGLHGFSRSGLVTKTFCGVSR